MNIRNVLLSILIIIIFTVLVSIASAGTGDVVLRTKVIQQPTFGQETATINVYLSNSFANTVSGSLRVLVTGNNGQTTYHDYSRIISLKRYSYNTIESFAIPLKAFQPGDYNVLVTFPVQRGERDNRNNINECGLYIPSSKPDPVPTPIVTPILVPVPELIPVSIPSQNVNTFDITISAQMPYVIAVPSRLEILITVSHNREKTVQGDVTVVISGNGINQMQTKEFILKHHDTVISNEAKWIGFNTDGWLPGTYQVTVSFPADPTEVNAGNNIKVYTLTVNSVPVPTKPSEPTKPIDNKIDTNNFQVSLVSVNPYIIKPNNNFEIVNLFTNTGNSYPQYFYWRTCYEIDGIPGFKKCYSPQNYHYCITSWDNGYHTACYDWAKCPAYGNVKYSMLSSWDMLEKPFTNQEYLKYKFTTTAVKEVGWSGSQIVSNYAYAWVKTGVVKT